LLLNAQGMIEEIYYVINTITFTSLPKCSNIFQTTKEAQDVRSSLVIQISEQL
jgi:hypothetical protein